MLIAIHKAKKKILSTTKISLDAKAAIISAKRWTRSKQPSTTPLMAASGVGWADGMLREYSEDQTLEVVKLLLDLGSDVNAANDHGITALHGAGFKGANKAVQLLVDHGAKLDALDKGEDYGFGVSSVRMTPLNWAEGVPIGMSSAIYHTEAVALVARLMKEQGIPVVYNSFHGEKPPEYRFGAPEAPK